MTTPATAPLPRPASFGPADAVPRALAWLRTNLFSTWYNTLLTVGALWLIWEAVSRLYQWGFATASFGPGPQSCQGIEGACWAMVRDMWPLFLS